MNIEDFREYCLSFKGAREKLPFKKANSEYDKNILVFYVGNKWFAFVNIDKFDFCDLKSDPIESERLREKYDGIKPGYHMNKKHWISVYFKNDVPVEEIKSLVKKSYQLIVNSLSRKDRKQLDI